MNVLGVLLCIRLTLEMDRQGVHLFRCTLSLLCKSSSDWGSRGRSSQGRWSETFCGKGIILKVGLVFLVHRNSSIMDMLYS